MRKPVFGVFDQMCMQLICIFVFLAYAKSRFSHDAAHFRTVPETKKRVFECNLALAPPGLGLNEPRSEKTGLRGVRPGPTQTGLYSQRRWLEA